MGAQNIVERLLLWDQDLKSGSLAHEVLFRSHQCWSNWESYEEFSQAQAW